MTCDFFTLTTALAFFVGGGGGGVELDPCQGNKNEWILREGVFKFLDFARGCIQFFCRPLFGSLINTKNIKIKQINDKYFEGGGEKYDKTNVDQMCRRI